MKKKDCIILSSIIGVGVAIERCVVHPYIKKKQEREAESLAKECMEYAEKRAEEAIKPLREAMDRMDELNKDSEETIRIHKEKLNKRREEVQA